MTGLYNQRIEAYHGAGNIVDNDAICMAQPLKDAGYATISTGKWHIKPNPTEVGFESQYGVLLTPVYYKPPNEDITMRVEGKTTSIPDDFYSVEDYTNYAMQAIQEESLGKGKPFFLYLAYHNAHWPLQAKPETINQYEGIYNDGTSVMRQQRYNRMADSGILDTSVCKLSPYPSNIATWDELLYDEKEGLKERMPIHTAMMDEMDEQIGRLTAFLKNNGLSDNTIIIYVQDNGASGEGGLTGDNWNPRGYGIEEQGKAGTRLSFYRLGKHAAVAMNTPLRRYKSNLYEGGCRTPMIVHWSGKIANPGSFNTTFTHVSDIAPTVYDIVGISYPSSYNGRDIKPLDGRSFLPALQGDTMPERTYCWNYEKHRSVRSGEWKLFGKLEDRKFRDDITWELYNLKQDQSESENMLEDYPEIAAELKNKWLAWSKDVKLENEYREKRVKKLQVIDNDGLFLQLTDSGRISDVYLNGDRRYTGTKSGFFVRRSNEDNNHPFVGSVSGSKISSGTNEFLFNGSSDIDVDIEATITEGDDYIEVEGYIQNLSGSDRGIWLGFKVPVNTLNWKWADDLSYTQTISSGDSYSSNIIPIPTAAGENGGVGLGIPPNNPCIFNGTVDANGISFEWPLGLSVEKNDSAHFKFRIFSVDKWGFRSALTKYYDWYDSYYRIPDKDMKNLRIPYIWFHSGNVKTSKLRIVDTGRTKFMAYLNPSGALRNENETFPIYPPIEGGYNVYGITDEDFQEALDLTTEVKWHYEPGELQRDTTIVNHTFCRYNNQGVLIIDNDSYRIKLPFNFDFDLPSPNKGQYMLDKLKGITNQGNINAFHWDRVGAWGAFLNYRKQHFKYTDHPLTFGPHGKVCMHLKLSLYDFFHEIRDYALENDLAIELAGMKTYNMAKKDMDAGGFKKDGRFFTASLAWSGWHEGNFKPIEYGGYDDERIFLGRKLYRISSGNIVKHEEEPTLEKIKRALSQCTAYGIVPALQPQYFYSEEHEGYDPVYSKYYNPDHKKWWDAYMPAINSIRLTGWEPVTRATVLEDNTLLERFGDEKPFYFTIWSPEPESVVTININAEKLGLSDLEVKENISNVYVRKKRIPSGWQLTVPMEKNMTRVLEIADTLYPSPYDGAVDIKLDKKLIYRKENNADSVNVYFGKDSSLVTSATPTADQFLTVEPGSSSVVDPQNYGRELEYKTSYYWRVDKIIHDSIVQGDVWTFTTRDSVFTAQFLVYGWNSGEVIPLDRADVTINNRQADHTDQSGLTTIDSIKKGIVNYQVTRKGYREKFVSVFMASDTTIRDTLDPELYTVKFRVQDERTGEPVEGCQVDFDGQLRSTGKDGLAKFEEIGYNYHFYQASGERYYSLEKTEVEIYSDTTLILNMQREHVPVSIKVIDQSTETALNRAMIIYDDNLKLTNLLGEADLTNVSWGKFVYTVKDGQKRYFPVTDSFTLTNDTSLVIALTGKEADIQFNVTEDDGNPVSNVEVGLNNTTSLTDQAGSAVFKNQPVYQGYPYYISKDNYQEIKDSLYLESDTVVSITLERLLGIHNTGTIPLQIFPNPVNEKFIVRCGLKQASLKLIGPVGELIMRRNIVSGYNEFEVAHISNGLYVLLIQTENNEYRYKLVIQ
jgi:arylsulfatase